MELNDIKPGVIFVLSWNRSCTCCIGLDSKLNLLDMTSPRGLTIDYVHRTTYPAYDNKWAIGERASDRFWKVESILLQFERGDWILIKDIEAYKQYPLTFEYEVK